MTRKPAGATELHRSASYKAVSDLTSELSLEIVLQKVADLSRRLVGASYSALGVLGEDNTLASFITSGISQKARDRIGRTPEGRGVLGVVIRDGTLLRLRHIAQHPESTGFPPHHPKMTSFLGVPSASGARSWETCTWPTSSAPRNSPRMTRP